MRAMSLEELKSARSLLHEVNTVVAKLRRDRFEDTALENALLDLIRKQNQVLGLVLGQDLPQ